MGSGTEPVEGARCSASIRYYYNLRTHPLGAFGPSPTSSSFVYAARSVQRKNALMLNWKKVSAGLLIVLSLCLLWPGSGCPHAGSDRRLLGRGGCWIQQKLTIEGAPPPRKLWCFVLANVSMKIDPSHPHLLIEWPTASGRFWRFRVGYRWDANARAYIFPAIAFKRANGPMREYQLK